MNMKAMLNLPLRKMVVPFVLIKSIWVLGMSDDSGDAGGVAANEWWLT